MNSLKRLMNVAIEEFKEEQVGTANVYYSHGRPSFETALPLLKQSALNTWEISGEICTQPAVKLAKNGNRYLIFTLKIKTHGLFANYENAIDLTKNSRKNYYLVCMTFSKWIIEGIAEKLEKGDIAVVTGFLNLETKRDLITKENKEIETVSSTNLLLNIEMLRIFKPNNDVIYSQLEDW